MLSIDITSALGYTQNHNQMNASVTFSFDTTTKVLTITDATTYPTGDERKTMLVAVYDRFGGKKESSLSGVGADSGNPTNVVTIDLDAATALNLTEGVELAVTLQSAEGRTKDGSVQDVATLKLSGSVTMQK